MPHPYSQRRELTRSAKGQGSRCRERPLGSSDQEKVFTGSGVRDSGWQRPRRPVTPKKRGRLDSLLPGLSTEEINLSVTRWWERRMQENGSGLQAHAGTTRWGKQTSNLIIDDVQNHEGYPCVTWSRDFLTLCFVRGVRQLPEGSVCVCVCVVLGLDLEEDFL